MDTKRIQRGVKPLFIPFLILAFLSVGIGMAAANPVVSIAPSTIDVCVGESIDVSIAVDPAGETLQVIRVDLDYDPTKASLSIADGGLFGIFNAGTSYTNSIDQIIGVDSGVTTSGDLAVVTITGVSPGVFTLDLNDVTVADANGNLDTTVLDGSVTVNVCDGNGGDGDGDGDSDGGDDGEVLGVPVIEIFPQTSTVCIGDTFDVNIEVDPKGNALQVTRTDLGFDSSLVSLTVDDGGMFGTFDPGASDTNSIDNILGLDTGVSTPGTLAVLHLTANSVGTFTLDLSDVVVGTADGTIVPVVVDGTVVIEECLGPQPRITNPDNGDTVAGMVLIEEVDDSGRNIVYNLFQYSEDGSTWTDIFNDTNGSDGWSANWDTTVLPDGDYLIGATMGDDEGLTGSTQIQVTLANPPEPRITNPVDGAKIRRGTTITIIEEDDSGQGDIDYNTFSYSTDGGSSWNTIGTDTDGSDGWSIPWSIPDDMETGTVIIKATMGDTAGNTGTDEISIEIVKEGITLNTGWNLFSVPHVLNNSSAAAVLEGVTAEALVEYDPNTGNFVNAVTIEPLKGYAILVSSPQTILNLDALPSPPGSLDLVVGFNLIGLTGYSSASAEDALKLGQIDDNYEKILNWDSSEQRFNLIGYNCNIWGGSCPPPLAEHVTTDDFTMDPYGGYFVQVTAPATYEGQV